MKFKRTFILLVSIVCVTVNVAGIVLSQKYVQLEQSNNWVDHTHKVITQIQGFYSNVEKMIAVQRGYLLSGNKSYFQRYTDASRELDSFISSTRELTADNPDQNERINQIATLSNTLRARLESRVRTGEEIGRIDIANDIDAIKNVADQVRVLATDMLNTEQELLNQRLDNSNRLQKAYFNTLVGASLGSIIVILAGNAILLTLSARQASTESDLAATKERLELALKGTNDGLFDWQLSSGDIFYSHRLREMLGYNEQELPNDRNALEALIHPDDIESARDYTKRFLNGEFEQYRNIFRIRHKDGSWHWHMARAVVIHDKAGKAQRMVGAHTDITESRLMEERIRQSNKELEEFTYIASHDLRSPLVNLKGFAGEIEHVLGMVTPYIHECLAKVPTPKAEDIRVAIDKEIPQALGFIKSSVLRMDKLTKAILDLSRYGRREMRMEIIDMDKLVHTCLETLRHQMAEKNISVKVEPLPSVMADSIAVEQIVGNILDNAVKYSEPSRPGMIEIGAASGASETTFHVRDNGRGISQADMKKVFEIFKRAGNNIQIPGEGMGMAYVQAMVRRLGGTIWCDSTAGEGTCFYFTIPHYIKKDSENA